MNQQVFTGVICAATLIFQVAPAAAADRAKIQKSIEHGVRSLKAMQAPDGFWTTLTGQHKVGATALAGLALLESNVSKKDPVVQKAAISAKELVGYHGPLCHLFSLAHDSVLRSPG
jgi:hypothetical protein